LDKTWNVVVIVVVVAAATPTTAVVLAQIEETVGLGVFSVD